ncbi:MAG: alanine--tRNA ligase, partial [Lachnospiraceae bacterium]|nr:alanine--tRNA ligase [Lachnospiraceae bacterium]
TDSAKILALASNGAVADALKTGAEGMIVTDKTPFYATMGGQCADFGSIKTASGEFKVTDTVKSNGRVVHIGKVVSGEISNGENAELSVDTDRRASICANHSATHLMQKALQTVLGDDVHQAGSYQDAERTRFDFSYDKAVAREELDKIEDIVNEKIAEDIAVITKVMSIDEAKASGAMALFGEKYGESVRVVNMGDFSKELCGGTHVAHTGQIRCFKILSESGVAAGVRRIEAITGDNVLKYYKEVEETLANAAMTVKSTPAALNDKLNSMLKEIKSLQSENESLKSKAAKEALGDVTDQVKEISGVKLLATKVSGVDMNGLRDLGDQLKGKIGDGVVVLVSDSDGKVNLVAMATDAAVSKGAHAGNLIKEIAPIVGGGGGGRPNMAQAGGKTPAGIDECSAKASDVLVGQLS